MNDSSILDFLKEQKYSDLLRWQDQLNHWTWPDDLPGKPENYDDLPSHRNDHVSAETQVKSELHEPVWRTLKQLLPHKECLRYHWRTNLNRSNSQFEEWCKSEPAD